MTDCGIFLISGFAMGISTLAVVYAVKWLRSRSIVRSAVNEIKKEDLAKQNKIAQAKKQIAEAKKVLEAVEEDEYINKREASERREAFGIKKEEAKEEPESAEGKYIEEEPKPKPKPKKTFFKKKEEPKEEVKQSIQIEE
jgi:hypothetical protein